MVCRRVDNPQTAGRGRWCGDSRLGRQTAVAERRLVLDTGGQGCEVRVRVRVGVAASEWAWARAWAADSKRETGRVFK